MRAVVLALIVVSLGCGGKPRVVSAPPPASTAATADQAPPTLPPAVSPTARILLQHDFTQLEVRGARQAERLWIEAHGDSLTLRPVSGSAPLETATGFRLEPAAGGLLRVAGKVYRGAFEAFLDPLGVPVLVNEVPMEQYLRGVVANELPPGPFPFLEALKAQAVAARTYAVRHLGSQASRGFDLFDDSRSQVYGGLASEQPLTDRAIDETRGVLARYGDEPIWALYFSTCGGITEGFEYAFGRPSPPYLRGGATCSDQRSRYHRWQASVSGADLSSLLSPPGGIREIVIASRSPNGRIVELEVEGESGRRRIRGSQFRQLLGLRSTAIDRLTPHRRDGTIDQLEVEGRGWGHGVGMCQIGAVELASRGARYDEILKHYYPGIELHGDDD